MRAKQTLLGLAKYAGMETGKRTGYELEGTDTLWGSEAGVSIQTA